MNPFDYVVVGAGSAGCVVASRLSEDEDVSVLLLEAGSDDDNPAIHDPRGYVGLFGSEQDWAFVTAAEPGLDDRCIAWPRGKVLGGTSAMNAMMYIRGNRGDFDHWASLGNGGWRYDEVLPWFLKSERNSRGASEWHGDAGPLDVSDPVAPHPNSIAFVDAAAELGHRRNADFNGERQDGTGLFQRTMRGGTRCSAARAFLHPVRNRSNLSVATGAEVTGIVIDGERAVGIRYVQDGEAREVGVTREAILCGGAVGSPQLLMLSGVGPAQHLRKLGLPVVADLPGVGQNLQDHPMTKFRCWTAEHRPVDATSNLVEAGLFCSARSARAMPDLYQHFLPVALVEMHEGRERAAFSIATVVLRPRSRGLIELGSPDPFAPPVIRANYFAERDDLELMVEGLKIARALAHARAFEGIFAGEALPGDDVGSDRALEAYVRSTGDTLFHPVGSCRMGNDTNAVVDARLRVHGITALRVVDASIMPTITSGPTNAPAILIGEKGAAMIREDRVATATC